MKKNKKHLNVDKENKNAIINPKNIGTSATLHI